MKKRTIALLVLISLTFALSAQQLIRIELNTSFDSYYGLPFTSEEEYLYIDTEKPERTLKMFDGSFHYKIKGDTLNFSFTKDSLLLNGSFLVLPTSNTHIQRTIDIDTYAPTITIFEYYTTFKVNRWEKKIKGITLQQQKYSAPVHKVLPKFYK